MRPVYADDVSLFDFVEIVLIFYVKFSPVLKEKPARCGNSMKFSDVCSYLVWHFLASVVGLSSDAAAS